jgi:hypothetical protein
MGMPVTTTLSSVGTSRAVNLDWMSGRYVSFAVTGSSSGSFTYTVEATLDDIQQTPAASVTWFTLSSSAFTANSSINLFQGPLGAIRANASAISSATLSLRILQGIGT